VGKAAKRLMGWVRVPHHVPHSTVVGARALIDSLDALSVFEAAVVDDYTRDWVERRVGGLDLRSGDLVMYISWDTPY